MPDPVKLNGITFLSHHNDSGMGFGYGSGSSSGPGTTSSPLDSKSVLASGSLASASLQDTGISDNTREIHGSQPPTPDPSENIFKARLDETTTIITTEHVIDSGSAIIVSSNGGDVSAEKLSGHIIEVSTSDVPPEIEFKTGDVTTNGVPTNDTGIKDTHPINEAEQSRLQKLRTEREKFDKISRVVYEVHEKDSKFSIRELVTNGKPTGRFIIADYLDLNLQDSTNGQAELEQLIKEFQKEIIGSYAKLKLAGNTSGVERLKLALIEKGLNTETISEWDLTTLCQLRDNLDDGFSIAPYRNEMESCFDELHIKEPTKISTTIKLTPPPTVTRNIENIAGVYLEPETIDTISTDEITYDSFAKTLSAITEDLVSIRLIFDAHFMIGGGIDLKRVHNGPFSLFETGLINQKHLDSKKIELAHLMRSINKRVEEDILRFEDYLNIDSASYKGNLIEKELSLFKDLDGKQKIEIQERRKRLRPFIWPRIIELYAELKEVNTCIKIISTGATIDLGEDREILLNGLGCDEFTLNNLVRDKKIRNCFESPDGQLDSIIYKLASRDYKGNTIADNCLIKPLYIQLPDSIHSTLDSYGS